MSEPFWTPIGAPGVVGAQGPAGSQGPKGVAGPQGVVGPTGAGTPIVLSTAMQEAAETVSHWNNGSKCGWYMGAPGTPGAPEGSLWWIGMTLAHDSLWCCQFAFDLTRSGYGDTLYTRRKRNGTWDGWNNIYGIW